MSTKNCKQTLIQTLKNEGSIKESQKYFRKFLREKDGNDDEKEEEMGTFELRLQFILDLENSADHEILVEEYFSGPQGIPLKKNTLRKELKGKLDEKVLDNKLKEAAEDVKEELAKQHDAWIIKLYQIGVLEDRSGE